jgi:hypothetical protein
MKVLELWRRTLPSNDGRAIDASDPLPLACAPAVSLAPELRDAQEVIQELEKERRKEDLAVENSIREVLAWAEKNRPKNTSKNYRPKQAEWKVSSALPTFILLFSL